MISFCSFAQTNENLLRSEVDLSDFGVDSSYNEYVKLKAKQEKLSDCEFGKKIANEDFDKKNYVYYSNELVGTCLYCNVLQHDYGIRWMFSSDLFSDDFYSCYNIEISQLLIQEYGFDIFKKASDKVDKLLKIKPMSTFYHNNLCIPDFIQGKERIYIHDSCIEDTLKIRYRAEVIFEHSLMDTIKPIVVKSVNLINMDIRSLNPPNIITSLSGLKSIESPLQQYIWNLCSAKIAYWYRFQPYNKLPSGERIKEGNTLYMGATIWLVPEL
jgi:hypothetical protein